MPLFISGGSAGRLFSWWETCRPAHILVSKYGNIGTLFQGAVYDSKREAEYALDLEARLRAGEIVSVSRQIPFALYGRNGGQVCTYRMDFVITLPNGQREAHEAKGYATEVWRLKKKLFLDCYPEIPLYVNGVQALPKRRRKKAL
jgi:hypothetical protein